MHLLVYRLGSLGDTVVALPCFRRIRTAFPSARITVLTNVPISGKAAPLAAVLEHTGLIDEVIPYPVGLRHPRELARLRRTIARERFDLAISLAAARGFAASVRDYVFLRSCGIPRVVGIPWRRRDLACVASDGVYENEADRLWRRLDPLRTGPEDIPPPDLGITGEERDEAVALLESAGIAAPFLSVSVGAKLPLKDWGEENWRTLLVALDREFPGRGLVLLGSPDEAGRSAAPAQRWTGPVANLCGRTSPRLSAAVLARTELFVGHDSGPAHLAAAAGAPTVAIFSAQGSPGQWFPRGPHTAVLYPRAFFDPRRLADMAHQRAALASITVEQVLAAAKSCLS